MDKLSAAARLKVKKDTFFLPDANGGVYFRNNVGSFRMEGDGVDQWIERLLPMFNGDHSMGELTSGLPDVYRDRVFEIAETLYQNGYVKDVSQDRPHQLSDELIKKYASQIEFISSFVDSGAYRFQNYRQAKVLAIGSGPFLVSLVSALLESGLPKLHLLITNSVQTNWTRIEELVNYYRKNDHEVTVEKVALSSEELSAWLEAVKPVDGILYVSQDGVNEELRFLHSICREEKKLFVPAVRLQQVALAGPLVHPDSDGCWESAWRRIHQSSLNKGVQQNVSSSTTEALLANMLVFEFLKTVTGVTKRNVNQIYLLNLETLEGSWHSFLPHPLVSGHTKAELIQSLDIEQDLKSSYSTDLLPYFSDLTSPVAGIFHVWEEGDLKQLPLAQCRVQIADPLSKGPSDLLPEIICNGLSHEEARREAGLAGIEAYLSRLGEGKIGDTQEYVGVGAGVTVAEGVCRGLQKCLAGELVKTQFDELPAVIHAQISALEDERCRFYFQALQTIQEEAPLIGLGEECLGFPVVWIGTKGDWFGTVGLNHTLALRTALQQALLKVQNHTDFSSTQVTKASSVQLIEKASVNLVVPAYEESSQGELLQNALQTLKRNGKQLKVFNLAQESFLKKELAGVVGVLLREEEAR